MHWLRDLWDYLRIHGYGPCPHHWRPAILGASITKDRPMPGRWCPLCGKSEVLEVAQFYVYFGRMPY